MVRGLYNYVHNICNREVERVEKFIELKIMSVQS